MKTTIRTTMRVLMALTLAVCCALSLSAFTPLPEAPGHIRMLERLGINPVLSALKDPDDAKVHDYVSHLLDGWQ